MKLVKNITELLAKLGMSLSILAGIVGAVWLLFLGEWQFTITYIVAVGIVSWIYSRFISVIIDKPFLTINKKNTSKNKTKNKKSKKILAEIADFILNDIIMYLWIALIAYNFYRFIKITGHTIPVLLLGYFVCILPVANLLSKDTHSEIFSYSILAFSQIVYFCLMLSYFTNYFIIGILVILVSLIMLTLLIKETTVQSK